MASSPTKKKAKPGGSQKGWVHREITCILGSNKAKCNHCGNTLSMVNITESRSTYKELGPGFQDLADQPEEEEVQPDSVDDEEENNIILCD